MTQVLDEKGRLQLPPIFRPGETVEIKLTAAGQVMVSKAERATDAKVELVTLPDGHMVITGLPAIDTEGVKKLLEDFP
jgi:hypothetical protein